MLNHSAYAFTVSLLFSTLLVSFPRDSAADITVEIHEPADGGVGGLILTVRATVTSEFALESVVASVLDRAAPLHYDDEAICERAECFPGWFGELSLEGLPKGDQTISVMATDILSNIGSASNTFLFDEPPVIVVHSPSPYAVARPDIQIHAECVDPEDGCSSLSATTSFIISCDDPTLTGVEVIDEVFVLDECDGYSGNVILTAADAAGNVTRLLVPIFVEPSTELLEVVSVNGRILDATARRVLFGAPTPSGEALFLWDRATDETLELSESSVGFFRGALGENKVLAVEKGGILSEFDGMDSRRLSENAHLDGVAAHHAIWNEGPLGRTLVYRDLEVGSSRVVDLDTANTGNDVARNGLVVFWTEDYEIWQYYRGETDLIASPPEGYILFRPVTDGHNSVYERRLGDPLASSEIILHTAEGAEIELSTGVRAATYLANDGWIAFTRMDMTDNQQLWLRSPTGEEEQATPFNSPSFTEKLGSNGELMFRNNERRYLASERSVVPLEVSSVLGFPFQHACEWYVAIGNTLFVVGDEIPEILNEPVGGCGLEPEWPDEEPPDSPDESDAPGLDAPDMDGVDGDEPVDADDLYVSPDSHDEPDMGEDRVDLVDVDHDLPDSDILDQAEPAVDAEEEMGTDGVRRDLVGDDQGSRERVSDGGPAEHEESDDDGCSCSMSTTESPFPAFLLTILLSLLAICRRESRRRYPH